MTELNGFINLTQLRKLTQQTLKPIVQEIQQQMGKMKKQSEFLKQQSQKSMIMFQKQQKFQQYMLQNQQQMRDVKIRLQQLKDEDIKSMLNTKKQITNLNQEIQSLKRQRAKYQSMINQQKKQNDRIITNFNKYQIWMDQKVQTMNDEYLKLKKDTLEMTTYVKSDYQATSDKFKQLQRTIQQKMLANDQKYKILQLYLTQRDQIKKKMIEIQQQFPKYALLDEIQYLRTCQVKQLQMNKTQINCILDTYLPPKIKQMLPQIQQKVQQFDKMSVQINDIKSNVFESQQQIIHFKQSTQSLQSNFRKQFKQINNNLTSHIQQLKTDVKVALAIDEKQTQERKKFQQLFSNKIHTFVEKQNEKTFKKMQEQTFSKLDERQKQDNSKMQQQHRLIEQKCTQMKEISENIQNLLANYNNRIIKIRSDSQLFKNEVMKQMKVISDMRNQNNERFQDLGAILASMIEVITMNLTIQMNLDKNCLRNDNFAFATYNDGLIYQTVPYNAKQGQTNNLNVITYRRTQLEIPHLRRSILAGMVTLIDRIYQSYPYLQWSAHKPSTFFKNQILNHYQLQYQKYGSFLSNTIQASSLEKTGNLQRTSNNFTIQSNDISSHLFKRSKISQKAYSPPRNQSIIASVNNNNQNTSKLNDTIYNNFQQLGQTIDQNIQIRVTHGQSSILMNTYDKQNIRRGMRTIHEVHARDANNNRFVLSGLGNRSSLSKDANMTVDHIPPQSAGGSRKRYLAKSKKQLRQSRYHNTNDLQTFMTSRSSKRTTSIGNYKF